MRVLITSDTIGGVWSYTRELVPALLSNNVSVVLVTLGRALSAEQSAWAESIASHHPAEFHLVPTEYKLEWMEDAGDDIEASRAYLEFLVAKYQPDLLHTNQFCFASLNLSVPIVLVAHSDVQSWWRAVHGTPPPNTDWHRSYAETVRQGVDGADIVVAPTHWMLNEIADFYGAPKQSRVIPNGCSPGKFQTGRPKHLQAVTLGRLWDEGKNIRSLEHVLSSVPILIAGDARPPAGSASSPFTAESSSNLRYLGTLTEAETATLLGESAIYIATSRYEPFGLALVEAAFSGCAILANDIPSLCELWGANVLYYAPNDPGSLAGILQILAGDPLLLQQVSRTANARAHAQFTSGAMTAAYLDVYSHALQLDGSAAHA